MRISSVDCTNNAKNNLAFKEVDECGLSWAEQKIALAARMRNLDNHVAERIWWENASEWEKFVRIIKDAFKNIFSW